MIEPLTELFSRSRYITLDFSKIPQNTEPGASIQSFFQACAIKNTDPKLPENRQRFNDALLNNSGFRYLVGRYAEDRLAMLEGSEIARQGRTLHLGVDVFAKDLERVFAPCDGQIVTMGNEPEMHSFGYYLIIKPDDPNTPYIFFGHLGPHEIHPGHVTAGTYIGKLGDYTNHQNGGWSRHLHLQMFRSLPTHPSELVGYSTLQNIGSAYLQYPDPMPYFPDWVLHS